MGIKNKNKKQKQKRKQNKKEEKYTNKQFGKTSIEKSQTTATTTIHGKKTTDRSPNLTNKFDLFR